MSSEAPTLSGPDLAAGVPLDAIPEGELFAAHAFGKSVLVVRRGHGVRAIGATCTHYSGPLTDGLLVGDTVRCPWHHACFSLDTGEAVGAPALNPVATWKLEVRGGTVRALGEIAARDGASPRHGAKPPARDVERIVIVGGGAAGNAAAERLRREGFGGAVTMISADDALPYDRPNLSKDFLAGNAPEEWIPLRSADFYKAHAITTLLDTRVVAVNPADRTVALADGRALPYDRLLLATGATPIVLPLPGGDLPHVHYLRTLADSRRIVAAAKQAQRAVVMGASFIGLEVAAALRARGIEVHVVAPEAIPLARVVGPELGAYVRAIHEQHGVVFHLEDTAAAVDRDGVTLKSGRRVAADLVVIGVGVRPDLGLAEQAGLALDRGVLVNEFLESSVPGIFAAGDIARVPNARVGAPIRVEHWVVAERQGQAAARNMLGLQRPFRDVPFFWSAHYDTTLSYVGHATEWDAVRVDGDIAAGDASVTLAQRGRAMAVITVGRDRDSLRAEARMEQE